MKLMLEWLISVSIFLSYFYLLLFPFLRFFSRHCLPITYIFHCRAFFMIFTTFDVFHV